ncbi:MAG: c-type cytochrome [Gammaproteobacteria bacterium]|nr:c-type cytochrome [Gammaproteobacteria bacterium]
MKYLKIALLISIFSFFTASFAQANEALARASGCLACHGIDKKIIGPGLKDIAVKYKGDKSAAATLATKVRSGGAGNWGQVPMPPNAHVKNNDIKKLVAWILSL